MSRYWNPMEDFCIRFSDKTAEGRTEEQLDEMVKRINEIANEYDFGVSQYGGLNCFKLAIKEEDRIIREANKLEKQQRTPRKKKMTQDEKYRLSNLCYKCKKGHVADKYEQKFLQKMYNNFPELYGKIQRSAAKRAEDEVNPFR